MGICGGWAAVARVYFAFFSSNRGALRALAFTAGAFVPLLLRKFQWVLALAVGVAVEGLLALPALGQVVDLLQRQGCVLFQTVELGQPGLSTQVRSTFSGNLEMK